MSHAVGTGSKDTALLRAGQTAPALALFRVLTNDGQPSCAYSSSPVQQGQHHHGVQECMDPGTRTVPRSPIPSSPPVSLLGNLVFVHFGSPSCAFCFLQCLGLAHAKFTTPGQILLFPVEKGRDTTTSSSGALALPCGAGHQMGPCAWQGLHLALCLAKPAFPVLLGFSNTCQKKKKM